MPATLFVDDQDPEIKYLCSSLHQSVRGSYYNNTWTTVQDEDCKNGWFEYTFYGTGVHVAASIAPGEQSLVKVDDGPFIPQPAGAGFFTSSQLSDGKHTITYAAGPGRLPPVLDYMTVTAGSLTPLKGRTVVADDTDDKIFYSGTWSKDLVLGAPFSDYSTSLYNNSTHWSKSIGDNIRFQFEGTSISIYGIVANISSGANFTAEYTVDGVSTVQGLPVDTLDSLPMVELFHANVDAGFHTVTMNITSIQAPLTLGVDFLAYNSSTEVTTSPSTSSASSSNQAPPWARAVVITVSLLAALLLLGSFATFWWRRKRSKPAQLVKNNSIHVEFGTRTSVDSCSKQ